VEVAIFQVATATVCEILKIGEKACHKPTARCVKAFGVATEFKPDHEAQPANF
jgi:hypothetical protein